MLPLESNFLKFSTSHLLVISLAAVSWVVIQHILFCDVTQREACVTITISAVNEDKEPMYFN